MFIKTAVIIFTFFIILAGKQGMVVAASTMFVSTNSNFSNNVRDFSAGQTIYVKVEANSSGETKRELNLRSNNYDLIKSYNLNKVGESSFSLNFPAPNTEGMYSLEAKVQSPGKNSTSVKTIKVGNSNSEVNVNIQTDNDSTNINESQKTDIKPEPSISPQPSPPPATTEGNEVESQSLAKGIFTAAKAIISFLWPF